MHASICNYSSVITNICNDPFEEYTFLPLLYISTIAIYVLDYYNLSVIRCAKINSINGVALNPAWWVLHDSLTGSEATEQSLLHSELSELARSCWLCNKEFNGHTASTCLAGTNTKSLFTVACPDVTQLSILTIIPGADASTFWLKYT